MSIIEKAVNALGKNGERDKPRNDGAGGPAAESGAADTVQRAEKGGEPPDSGNMVKIPFKELRELGMLTPSIPRSAIAEEYRTIKRPLLINIAGDSVTPPIPHGNLIMVTSARPIEARGLFQAVTVTGTLSIADSRTEVAETGYRLNASDVSAYSEYRRVKRLQGHRDADAPRE